MKKIILSLLGFIAAAIVVILIVASTRPSQMHVERAISVDAPREVVWPIVSDLKRFDQWSPYAQRDPDMNRKVEVTPELVGSTHAWDGNSEVGAGKMTITSIAPLERVDIKLEMIKPVAATNAVAFVLVDEDGKTRVTWSMDAVNEGFPGLISKAFGLFIDMDEMIGADFETGLRSLKAIAEGRQ